LVNDYFINIENNFKKNMYLNATLEKKQKKVAVSAVFEINLNKKHPYFYWDFYKKTTAQQEALEEWVI